MAHGYEHNFTSMRPKGKAKMKNAFTLIELLVVVAIIGILAAIVVPNYQKATIKSKVARAQVDLRNVGTALHQYRVDQNVFPRKSSDLMFFVEYVIPDLTTPIPYLGSAIGKDPFGPVNEYEAPEKELMDRGLEGAAASLVKNSYTYTPYKSFAKLHNKKNLNREAFSVTSVGPDRMDSYLVDYPFPDFYRYPGESVRDSVYNPSNGVQSLGDIGFFGGDLPVSGLVGG